MSDARAIRSERPRLSRDIQDGFRRRRIVDALAAECVERGYSATTIAHVSARARCARGTIYGLFANKEAIFLALLEGARAELDERVERACMEVGPDGGKQLEAALSAILEWVALDPPTASALLVAAPTAGPAASALQMDMLAGLVERLREVAPPDPSRPQLVEEFLVDGIASILRYLVLGGEAKRAPGLLPTLSAFLEQPYLDGGAGWSAGEDSA